MLKQMILICAIFLSSALFAGEVMGTVKMVVNGKAKNFKDATLVFTYKKDTTKFYSTLSDLMGSYSIYLPDEGEYSLKVIPETDGSHDASETKAVSIVSFEKSTRYDLEVYKKDNEWKLNKK